MTTREVVLDGGSPWGFRLHGGIDTNQPLRISRVNPGSKAAQRCIREGDFITSINGQSTKDLTNAEAHALLRNSGDTLKLGLNEDQNGSPKRRQFKTVHQETHSETIKKSSVTSYTVTSSSKTISQNETTNNENSTPGNQKNISLDNTIASQRSTVSSVSSPSSSTYTEGALPGFSTQQQQLDEDQLHLELNTTNLMSDNLSITRTRRKRSRNQRKKTKTPITKTIECNVVKNGKNLDNLPPPQPTTTYRVESPTKQIDKKAKLSKSPIKSKSLDDDDMVKIQELTETNGIEEKTDNKAIILEVDSDVDQPHLSLAIPENPNKDETVQLSPEEEITLRNFLDTLNLINSPEDAFRYVNETNNSENLKIKRAKKRQALEQYFLPMMQNPRYLEVINEETGDTSDREQQHIKHSTPENELETKPILVGTKIIETPIITHEICNKQMDEPITDTEVVYLEDSSDEETNFGERETREEKHEIRVSIKKNNTKISDTAIKSVEILSQLTPPPTPDSVQDNEINSEIDNFCNQSELAKATICSNVISPSPTLSSDSSSRATTLSTVKYNPMNSSIGDIESLIIKDDKLVGFQPETLRELCLKFLLSQPFGVDVLQELASVSLTIDTLTNKLSERNVLNNTKLPAFMLQSNDLFKNFDIAVNTTAETINKDGRVKISDNIRKLPEDPTRIVQNSNDNVSNRLLAIIRNEPAQQTDKNDKIDTTSARLNAKDLDEWLDLARNKSTSESNLNTLIDQSTNSNNMNRRRASLPFNFYERQMQYILEKEKEIEQELERLEDEKRKLTNEISITNRFQPEDFHISRKGDFAENRSQNQRPISMPTEIFRQQMYEEYMDKIAAREERKQLKVIKVTTNDGKLTETKHIGGGIEDEFMDKVKEKQKLGKLQIDQDDNKTTKTSIDDKLDDSEPVLVIDGDSLRGTNNLPKHLQEFVDITKHAATENNRENSSDGIWSPGQKQEHQLQEENDKKAVEDEPIAPVWTPKSATSSPNVERKEFRPVKFESPVLSRKDYTKKEETTISDNLPKEPPTPQKRLPTSHSSPVSGFGDFSTSRLPKAQNPTITLLQKAREGQLPKGASYIDQDQDNRRPSSLKSSEIRHQIRSDYISESDSEKSRKMADLNVRKIDGIGPTTTDGMPLILRSEIKDANQSKWYKKMYDTIHRQRPHRDEYVTVRYRQKRAQYPYSSGYLSEPEPGAAYDSDFSDYTRYATLDRRRLPYKENDYNLSSTMPRAVDIKSTSDWIKHDHDPYRNEPGRIENYTPGHSSISEKEAKEHLEQQKRVPHTKSFINQALKESGYESDSTLVFKRKDEAAQQLSPLEQKEVYKVIQKGGDIPLHGLRKPAPERPKESPRKYVEDEVTIHYKTPVRHEIKEYLSEDELAHRQAEAMKKIYQEERRRKYLQELQDMNNRRHTDNFIPSQKSPIPLNRYDDFDDLAPPAIKPRPRSPERRLIAKALYNFVGQTARELTFRKGDLIYIRRQVDKNWYEGELNAMVGLFPVNYVEIVTYDPTRTTTPRKPHEGQARAKFNFVAQTHLELSLAKGELVVLTRRVDDNWFEGKIGGRKGIFPVSYVDILIDPSDPQSPQPPPPISTKPVAVPAAHSLLLNGSAGGKESMGSHSYMPNFSINQQQLTTTSSNYHAKPVQVNNSGSYGGALKGQIIKSPVNQALHIETQSEPVPYRAMYKYLPQNDDELELLEGDTVYVLEKCDDGWYVGSSERTGAFGTFPGNYVEKI